MKKTELHEDLEQAIVKLLEMARNSCWNMISDNCEFIISEIDNDRASNFFEERHLRKMENSNSIPISMGKAIEQLKQTYSNLHDVNLYIFHAMKNKTVIDIRYFPKSKLDIEYQQHVIEDEPMLHCKISIPPYHTNSQRKYDINWELGGIRDQWNMFWWRCRNKLKISQFKN